MLRKTSLSFIAALLLLVGSASFAADITPLFQYSTIEALLAGAYDGSLTVGELKRHGDLGLGTFNGLDGEMVMDQGQVYRVGIDGRAVKMPDEARTPFAVTAIFSPSSFAKLEGIRSLKDLEEALDRSLPCTATPFAIRIEGSFPYLKTRSVPQQTKPYPPLVEAVKQQRTFEFKKTEGVILGFRCPESMRGLNVAGYHFHFLTKDRTGGGHLLDCRFPDATAEIDCARDIRIVFPDTPEFNAAGTAAKGELEKVER